MKTKTLSLTVILLMIAGGIFTACNGGEPEIEVFPQEISFTEYSLPNFGCWWTRELVNELIVINSKEELENHIWCTTGFNYHPIDFSNYTLLLINGVTSAASFVDSIGFFKFDAEKYILTMRTVMTGFAEPSGWTVSILVPKICYDATIEKKITQYFPTEISFTEISLINTGCSWTIGVPTNELFVINTKEDLEKYITCADDNTFPEIDFSNYTLLLTRGFTPTVSFVESISFLNTAAGKYVLTVKIGITPLTRPHNWSEVILVPKIPNGANVERIVINI